MRLIENYLYWEYYNSVSSINDNNFWDFFEDLDKSYDNIETDPEEFKKLALDLYNKLAGMERDRFCKGLSNSNIPKIQIRRSLEREAERLTQDTYLIDNFYEKFNNTHDEVRAFAEKLSRTFKIFKENPCLDTMKAIQNAFLPIVIKLGSFEKNYRSIILDCLSTKFLHRLCLFMGGCGFLQGFPDEFVKVFEKEEHVDPELIQIASELFDLINEYLDKGLSLLNKEDGLDAIRKLTATAKGESIDIKKRLDNIYSYLNIIIP